MCRIDLIDLLACVEDYVLLKRSETFPYYNPGSDVDLLVMDREEALRSIRSFYEALKATDWEMSVTDTPGHCHVDFIFSGELDIRVDLIDGFDFYTKFVVKPSFLVKVFRDRQMWTCDRGDYFVPASEDDLTIRYFEYLEYFDQLPDKIKHLDYICGEENELLKRRFFENTHRFIRFKRKEWVEPVKAAKYSEEVNSCRIAMKNTWDSIRVLVKVVWRSSYKTMLRYSKQK